MKKETGSSATIVFEAKLWLAADKLRNNMDAAVSKRSGDRQPEATRKASAARPHKHVVLGLSFLKHISDTSESKRAESERMKANPPIPTSSFIRQTFPVAIARDNPRTKGVQPNDYARPSVDTATRESASLDCEATPRDFCAAKDHRRLSEPVAPFAA